MLSGNFFLGFRVGFRDDFLFRFLSAQFFAGARELMRCSIVGLTLMVLWQGVGLGASRTWKSRKGVEVKAEFTGVINGKVVLKLAGGIRQPVRLSDFSLEDRDFLVKELTKRDRKKDKDQLLQLMAFENNIPVIDPDKVRPSTNPELGTGEGEYDPMGIGSPNPLPGNPGLPNGLNGQQQPEVETEMYGLPLPSPGLLVEDSVRSWTSLLGSTQLARFDRVLAPGFFRLKKADGSTGDFAMVNFSKEDIEYVKQALQKDMARPVFPEGNGFQSLTPDDVSKGYRVWTDRKKVPLVGKFVSVKGKDVVIEVNGEEKEYPKAGLSEADRTWVNNEIRRRAEEAAARAQAAASNSGGGSFEGGTSRFPRPSTFPSRPTFPRPSFGGSRFGGHSEGGMGDEYADAGMPDDPTGGSRFGGGRTGGSFGPTFPTYEFTCDHCGKSWTESSPISRCPDCKDKSFFTCSRCGYEWTRNDGSMISKCPRCANGGTDPGATDGNTPTGKSSSGSGGKKSKGVLMTIVYIVTGLAVLGGIAAGLIRSFG